MLLPKTPFKLEFHFILIQDFFDTKSSRGLCAGFKRFIVSFLITSKCVCTFTFGRLKPADNRGYVKDRDMFVFIISFGCHVP
jgi:hypothetical protein